MNVYGNGLQTRSYCNIIDAIPIIIKICFFGKHFVYNVGNDKNEISANKLAINIAKVFGYKKYKIYKISYPKEYPSYEPQRRCPNINKIKKELNFRNNVGIEEAIKRFYNWSKKYY